ncbi:MAG: MmcQ/YjbR family DNA-binding protein [Pyrinomonadaceae bacterium]
MAVPIDGAMQIERVRGICMVLPEVTEKLSHGEPTFFVRKKVFAMCSNNHHNDGHVAALIPAAIGIQEMLIAKSPKKFYRPPYVGVRGWVGIELPHISDKELRAHLREAWCLIAPEKLHSLLHKKS